MTDKEQVRLLYEALAELVTAVEACEDKTAMPDGTEGTPEESYWVMGNVGKAEMDNAKAALKRVAREV